MEKQLPPCHRHQAMTCCQDEAIVHDGEDFQVNASQLNIDTPFVAVVNHATVFVSEIIPSQAFPRSAYYNYDPPLPSTDLIVAHGVFLI